MDRRQFITAAGAFAATLPGLALAQALENARIICGFPAGGTTDAVSRRIADKLRGGYSKVMLVENKPGAGGRIGVEELRRSPPDGTSLLLTPAAMITLYPHVYTKLPYGIDDVTPVCTACRISFAFGVGPGVPESVKDIKDFLAWAKANPTQANYGTPGAGSPPHLLGMLLAKESGVPLSHVPYRGSAPGLQDLLGGQVASMSSPIGDYLPYIKTGKLRVLATSGPKRSAFTPEVATYTEQGFKALEMQEWYGFFLPGKAPADVVNRAASAIRAAVQQPDVAEAFTQLGFEPFANTPAELAKAVKDENAAWGPIVKRVGFTPET
ncbi:Bug family tripartite tricarboxylate transporter substrate binding protein [Piscinibacter sp. XHJ-5]|uniref:Bug family tripartite tricarboxylate transporter substrate binding protein n=1 Tax=Piscinibacter sp. XHJ-5 TaxID=3037797 RepID=UPI00245331BA|nr:Bug family tripartite tricarboxylate transporter substrate binding protein [Piscinibacter sp. XHJ-5]